MLFIVENRGKMATSALKVRIFMRLPGLFAIVLAGCGSPETPPPPAAAEKIETKAIENFYRVTPTLYSGGSPETDAAFEELKSRGVTVIISVDGTTPDVEKAHRFGMKYVHLPVGYDGINTPTAYKLAKAVQTANGPVYLHCHHGKHRGPTAVALVRLCLEPNYTPADAVTWMTLAGTDEKYKGLYRMPRLLVRPSAEQLDAVPAELPEKSPVQDLTLAMVRVDAHWDEIKAAKGRDWIGAENAATLLVEDFREARRALKAGGKGDEFITLLVEAEQAARELADLVKAKKYADAAASFAKSQGLCTKCHSQYRD